MNEPSRNAGETLRDAANTNGGLFSPGSPSSWYVCEDGKTEGPLREQRIAQLIAWGRITARAYVCDEQLSSWVSIRRTAFAAILATPAPVPQDEREVVHALGALRGGPWRLSTRALQRLSGLLAALSVAAGALQLASGLAMTSHTEVARASARSAFSTSR